jgi:DNA polymerase-4
VTLKVRYADFRTITRARSFAAPVADIDSFLVAGSALLSALMPVEGGVRLLGLTLSGIAASGIAAAAEAQPALPL